ncbi:hypothetical protein M426DRAFT_7605 [Hypoxylon sp. CI-4A]|nr:hypothetical protein M426DRAFT_7605 [Hypoxylon sp. CI-4A]
MEPRSEVANGGEDADTIALASSNSSFRLEATRMELPLLRFWLLSIGLLTGLLLSLLDTSIVATSLFTIGSEFNALTSVNWVALAYTLTYLGCAVLSARISDIIGRRNAFIAFYIMFLIFSIACGFAQSLAQLIACRAVQGIGGSGLYSIAMIVLLEVAPERLHKVVGGIIAIVITIASILGPVLGGTLTRYTTWRWIFWINGPIGVVSVTIFFFTWPRSEYLPDIRRKSWKELDYFGSILLIVASTMVVFPFQIAGELMDQWSKAIFIAPLAIGVVSWFALIFWSILVDICWGDMMDAAIPMRLLRDRVYVSVLLNTLFLGFPYMLVVYAFPLRLQIVNGKDALTGGIMLLPMLGSSAVGTAITGALNSKQNRVFESLLVATISVALGCGLMSTLSASFEVEPKALGFLVFIGFGWGIAVSIASMVATIHSTHEDHAPAQGMMAQVRVLGGSIGIAASSAILGVFLQERVGSAQPRQVLPPQDDGASSTEGQYMAVRQAYSDAFNKDMQVCAIIGGIAVLLVTGTYSRKRLTLAERQTNSKIERRKAARSSQRLVDETSV